RVEDGVKSASRSLLEEMAQSPRQLRLSVEMSGSGFSVRAVSIPRSPTAHHAPEADRGLAAISLFTGAGGLDLGCESAGFTTRAAVEVDDLARQTLLANAAKYFPTL